MDAGKQGIVYYLRTEYVVSRAEHSLSQNNPGRPPQLFGGLALFPSTRHLRVGGWILVLGESSPVELGYDTVRYWGFQLLSRGYTSSSCGG